jgi:hypothetical protein
MLAVETRLAGIDYRSRTEAEWAAMLTAHRIRFDYEPILFRFGFVAPSDWSFSKNYIPDFWLPDLRLWLEVKPHLPNLIEYRKAALLAECTGSGVLVTTGGPGFDELLFVKDLRRAERVSTIGAAPLGQAPLKLDVDILTNTPFFGRSLRPFSEGIVDCIDASNDALIESMGWAKDRRKRVLFLAPGTDHRRECFCDETQPTYCPRCSGALRALLTDESYANLLTVGIT